MDVMKTTDASGGVSLTELHAANIARQAEWCPDQLPDLSFRGNELAGETGEACNVIKKLERERHGWRGSRATKEQLAEELADVVICADLCAVTAGIDLDAAVRDKFNATSEKVGLTTKLAALASTPPAPTPDAGSDLAKLSAAAAPGALYATTSTREQWFGEGDHARLDLGTTESAQYTISLNPNFPGWETDSGNSSYCISRVNALFIAALWNAYRSGRLVEASASPPPAEDLAGQGEPDPTWPEWVEQCVKIIRKSSGYDGFDDAYGVDLPAELQEHIHALESEIAELRLELAAATPAPGSDLKGRCEYRCVGGHDLCHDGHPAGADCPYCERSIASEPTGDLTGQGETLYCEYEFQTATGWETGYMGVRPCAHPSHRNIRPIYKAAPRPAGAPAGQGEPVAWAYEWFSAGQKSWRPALSFSNPSRDPVRNIRPLYAAPAPSRPADREEIVRILRRELELSAQTWEGDQIRIEGFEAAADAILALRDAPRDAGDGWRPIAEKPPEADWIVYLPDGADDGMGWALDTDERLAALLWWSSAGPGRSDVTHFREPVAGPPSPNPTDGTHDTGQGGGRWAALKSSSRFVGCAKPKPRPIRGNLGGPTRPTCWNAIRPASRWSEDFWPSIIDCKRSFPPTPTARGRGESDDLRPRRHPHRHSRHRRDLPSRGVEGRRRSHCLRLRDQHRDCADGRTPMTDQTTGAGEGAKAAWDRAVAFGQLRASLDIAESRAASAEAEVERLKARLEIDHAYDGAGNRIPFPAGIEHLDGIACRDETIRQQDGQIARLTRERDEARSSDAESLALYRNCRDRLEASASALRDRVAVLESALKPFAEACNAGNMRWVKDEQVLELLTRAEVTVSEKLRGRDFRAARAALKGGSDA